AGLHLEKPLRRDFAGFLRCHDVLSKLNLGFRSPRPSWSCELVAPRRRSDAILTRAQAVGRERTVRPSPRFLSRVPFGPCVGVMALLAGPRHDPRRSGGAPGTEKNALRGGAEGDAMPPATTPIEEYRMTHRPRTSSRGRMLWAALAGIGIAACSSGEHAGHSRAEGANAPPTTAELAQRLVESMGGIDALNGVETLVGRGSGMRTRIGQIRIAGGEDWTLRVEQTETIDLANGRAAFDYAISNDQFNMQRTEVYTSFEGTPIGWNTGPGRPQIATSPNGIFSWATQNSPQ